MWFITFQFDAPLPGCIAAVLNDCRNLHRTFVCALYQARFAQCGASGPEPFMNHFLIITEGEFCGPANLKREFRAWASFVATQTRLPGIRQRGCHLLAMLDSQLHGLHRLLYPLRLCACNRDLPLQLLYLILQRKACTVRLSHWSHSQKYMPLVHFGVFVSPKECIERRQRCDPKHLSTGKCGLL